MTPVINHWVGSRNNIATVVMTNPKFPEDDERLNHLDRQQNCEMIYPSGLFESEISQRTMDAKVIEFLRRVDEVVPTNLLRNIFNEYIRSTNALLPELPSPEAFLNRVSQDISVDFIAFDWNASQWAGKLVDLCHDQDIPTVSLPHGDIPFVNKITKPGFVKHEEMFEPGSKQIKFRNHVKRVPYSCTVSPNATFAEVNFSDLPEREIEILGSPRYNEESIEFLTGLYDCYRWDGPNEFNVVIFSRKPSFGVDHQLIMDCVLLMSRFQKFNIVIQRHTRSDFVTGPFDEFVSEHEDELQASVQIVGREAASKALLNWGDLFVDCGTSVSFEPVVRDMPVIALELTHPNRSTLAHYLPSCAARTFDDLLELCNRFLFSEDNATYSPTERKRFLDEMIYNHTRSPLDNYDQFLNQTAEQIK
jgi:hypothetical protein